MDVFTGTLGAFGLFVANVLITPMDGVDVLGCNGFAVGEADALQGEAAVLQCLR